MPDWALMKIVCQFNLWYYYNSLIVFISPEKYFGVHFEWRQIWYICKYILGVVQRNPLFLHEIE